MKLLFFFGVAVLTAAQVCSAATCASGTLASYEALGSAGCTIGGDTLSNFTTLSGTTGAMELSTGAVSINPSGGTADPSLAFTTTQTANANALLETIFTYTVSGQVYSGAATSLSNSSETNDGAVSNVENFCAGGSFGPDGVSGCSGSAGSLLTLDVIQNSDASGTALSSFLSVTDDFTLDGGLSGSATGGTFTNSFTATPEPASLALGMLGLALVAGGSRRKAHFSERKTSGETK